MIERLRRHPRSRVLSRYVESDLDARRRRAVEAHLRDCPRCQRDLASLTITIRAVRSLEAPSRAGLAESIVGALRAEEEGATATSLGARDAASAALLTVIAGSGRSSGGEPVPSRVAQEARAALRWCLQRRQLRLTLPIAVLAGVVLSLVNMGGTLLHGRIDLGVCVSCTVDFLVPFLTVNLGLVMLVRLPRRGRL